MWEVLESEVGCGYECWKEKRGNEGNLEMINLGIGKRLAGFDSLLESYGNKFALFLNFSFATFLFCL